MSTKYVCKACGYIYPTAHYQRGQGCIHCAHGAGLAKRDVRKAIALADEIKKKNNQKRKP